jgi:glycosyltransferase involved in cell wall biosynthesis
MAFLETETLAPEILLKENLSGTARKKILIVSTNTISLPPKTYGGVERTVVDLVRHLSSLNYEVAVACKTGSTLAASSVFFLKRSSLFNMLYLVYICLTFRPAVVHNFGRTKFIAPLVLLPVKLICTFQIRAGRSVSWLRRLGGRKLFFTTCSEHMTATNESIIKGGNWTRIYNFLDVGRYSFEAQVESNAPIVFLSRVFPLKGAHEAIEVAKKMDLDLIIAGNADLDSHYWKNRIMPFLSDKIRYIGEVDDIEKNRLLGEASALILPIQWDEPFGLVFIEALACGTPVISYNRGAAPEIICDGVEGFLVQDKNEFESAIRQISKLDRQACRRKAEKFDYHLVADEYHQLYRKILGQ